MLEAIMSVYFLLNQALSESAHPTPFYIWTHESLSNLSCEGETEAGVCAAPGAGRGSQYQTAALDINRTGSQV